ncbi:MAG: RNA polymerase sigma factor [Tannerellaceae bacterium]|jgi:RNA polymerase sigma-70 factor (ECF subfamily)|nr:RNA polymerase sigma factor [Tannerellaceae bacterium]
MDAESFKRQFLPCHPRLYRIAYALTGNSMDAEDVLQDAYCKLWNKREELGQINNTEAFCITLVKNLCFDLLRSPGKNMQEEAIEHLPLSTGISPETEAIGQDEAKQIQRLIDKLPEKQRQVIRLRGINDCSLEEIEMITGLSAVNVRVLLSRARKVVKEQYLKIKNYER